MITNNILSKITHLAFIVSGLFLWLMLYPRTTFASEGTVELRSTGTEPYRCYAVSIRMQDPEYRILFTCKFILYPADENVFHYVAWATPEGNGRDVRLGTIGVGRGEFKTKNKFTSIYVTTEVNKDTRNPSGRVVMKGNVEPIGFMEEVKYYEPTPTMSTEENQDNSELSVTPTEDTQNTTTSTKDKIFTAFKRAGVAAVVAMVALAGLIFVITRSRG